MNGLKRLVEVGLKFILIIDSALNADQNQTHISMYVDCRLHYQSGELEI